MRWPSRIPTVSALRTREFRVDLRPLGRLARERPEAVVLGLGVALRVVTYLWNRAMWLDEVIAQGERRRRADPATSPRPLASDQLAPFGFLIVAAGAGDVRWATAITSCGSCRWRPDWRRCSLFARLASPRPAATGGAGRAGPVRALRRPDLLLERDQALLAGSWPSDSRSPWRRRVRAGSNALDRASSSGWPSSPPRRPWFSFASAFVVAGLRHGPGPGRPAGAVVAARPCSGWRWPGLARELRDRLSSLARHAQSPTRPCTASGISRSCPWESRPPATACSSPRGLLLEVFVNPLNLLAPGGSRLGVVLPLSCSSPGASPWPGGRPGSSSCSSLPIATGPRRVDLATLSRSTAGCCSNSSRRSSS